MPELNFDKVLASLKLRLDEVLDESEFDEILKEYAGKESLLSAERKNLSNLSNEDKKIYGETLNNVNKSIVTNIKKAKEEFINNKYASLEDEENEDFEEDHANVSLAAMESSLKPQVLKTLKKIADAYSKLSSLQNNRMLAAIKEKKAFLKQEVQITHKLLISHLNF